MSEQKFEVEGIVTHILPGTKFKVALPNKREVLCTLCGKIKKFYIKVMVGDRVKIEVGSYDLTQGRIVFRYK